MNSVGTWSGRPLLIDTNLLLVLAVGLVRRDQVERFKRTSAYEAADFDRLVRIVESAGRLVTTHHVLAEVSNLGGQLSGRLRTQFFEVLRQLAVEQLEDESPPSPAFMKDPVFTRLGVADTAILRIDGSLGAVVLSDDLGLYLELTTRGIEAVNFNHIRTATTG